VDHDHYRDLTQERLNALFADGDNSKKVLIDVKGLLNRAELEAAGYQYWRL
jgi:UDP-N-acetyl-D-galactosamine dehydrogenase